MANAAALINEGLWRRDKEFQKLPRLAQCTFCQVLTQKDLDTAGVLTLYPDILAKGCEELTVEQLESDFATLEEHRFAFVDYDTDELLIRSYVRLVSIKSPNAWRSVPKNARLIASPKIRHELATELRRLRRKDADELADEIDPVPTPSEPVKTPSKPDTPSEPGLEPPSSVPVLGQVTSVCGQSREGTPPPRYCPKHPNGTDQGCWACKQRREIHEAWIESEAVAADLAARAESERQAAIAESCQICHGTNFVEVSDNAVRPCDHQEAM